MYLQARGAYRQIDDGHEGVVGADLHDALVGAGGQGAGVVLQRHRSNCILGKRDLRAANLVSALPLCTVKSCCMLSPWVHCCSIGVWSMSTVESCRRGERGGQ